MNTSYLAGLIFFIAFMGMVLVHELGHYLACLLVGVEAEEFGFGIPPRAWRFWRLKGSLTVGKHKVVIPANYDLPFDPHDALERGVEVVARRDGERLVLESISLAALEDGQFRAHQPGPMEGSEGKLHFDGILNKVSQGTEFTLNWLPLGGFVRPKGENDPNVEGGLAAASPWKRLFVLFAGPTMNLLTAAIVFSVIFHLSGIPSRVQLVDVLDGSPAAQAGLQVGDVILSVDGNPMPTVEGMRLFIRRNLDRPVTVLIERAGQTQEIVVTPLSSRYQEGAMGILMDQEYVMSSSWFSAIPAGLAATGQQSYEIISLPSQILRGLLAPEEGRLMGLGSMFKIFDITVATDVQSRETAPVESSGTPQPSYATLELFALLSISIGIFNLLPFPALDGGRIAFVLPELFLRRRVPPQFENAVHAAGMIFLILLMVYVNAMDFINPIVLPTH